MGDEYFTLKPLVIKYERHLLKVKSPFVVRRTQKYFSPQPLCLGIGILCPREAPPQGRN